MTYTIRSVRETGTITYHCSTTQNALEKLQDFQRSDYRDIVIQTSEEYCITEHQLISLAHAEQGRAAV